MMENAGLRLERVMQRQEGWQFHKERRGRAIPGWTSQDA
jgi:hypothetical protein